MEYARDKQSRKDLPQLGPMKFGMFNYVSKRVKPQDLTRTARMFVYPDTPNDLCNEQQQLHVTTAIFPDEQVHNKQYVQYNLT